eukprot:353454-Chlamydomonas_euryale.AAC.7
MRHMRQSTMLALNQLLMLITTAPALRLIASEVGVWKCVEVCMMGTLQAAQPQPDGWSARRLAPAAAGCPHMVR